MSSPHLSNEEFFVRLSQLFDTRREKDHGSIFLEQKRMSYGASADTISSGTDTPFPDQAPSKPLPVLIRATDGKSKAHRIKGEKTKLSTVVEADQLEGFYTKYVEVCKLGMTGLKKRDRSKNKSKLKAKRKKGGAAA